MWLHLVAKFINNASGAMGPLCLWQCLDILVGPSFDSDTQHQQASYNIVPYSLEKEADKSKKVSYGGLWRVALPKVKSDFF